MLCKVTHCAEMGMWLATVPISGDNVWLTAKFYMPNCSFWFTLLL